MKNKKRTSGSGEIPPRRRGGNSRGLADVFLERYRATLAGTYKMWEVVGERANQLSHIKNGK